MSEINALTLVRRRKRRGLYVCACGTRVWRDIYNITRSKTQSCGCLANPRRPLQERFWERVKKTPGCWFWLGPFNKQGYGVLSYGGRSKTNNMARAHRLSWQFHNKRAPVGLVLHTCDTPKCVNPQHLYEGTQADNVRDMVVRGRATIGEKNAQAKLACSQVREIAARFAEGETQRELAEEFGVVRQVISAIVTGQRYSSCFAGEASDIISVRMAR